MQSHPFVILFYVHIASSLFDADCFQQLRVHYPNAPVLLFRSNDTIMPTYLDEYTVVFPKICMTSLDVWKAFYRDTKHLSGLLWPSHFFIGSIPLPPLLSSRFLWLRDGVISKPSTPHEAEESKRLTGNEALGCPTVVDLYGYFRRSLFDESFLELREPRTMILYVALKNATTHVFSHGPEHDGQATREYVDALKMCRAPVFQLLR